MSSLLEQLQIKRAKLKPTNTIVTTPTGERFLVSNQNKDVTIKLENIGYGFVEDTKPDTIPAEIMPEFLYLGSQDAVTMENVKSYGLTHILSVGVNAYNETEFATIKINHKYLTLLDLPETNLFDREFIKEAFDFITLAKDNNGRILIHCNAGVSRAASVVLAYLMEVENLSFEIAYALVKSKRECIRPNDGFMRQLREFNKNLL